MTKYRKGFICEECLVDHPPYRIGLCNNCYGRLQHKGYMDYDRAQKGSGSLNTDGYRVITRDNKNVLEHRVIMEDHLGRKLTDKEVVHHINKNRAQNNINNLQLFANQSEHLKHHRQETSQ